MISLVWGKPHCKRPGVGLCFESFSAVGLPGLAPKTLALPHFFSQDPQYWVDTDPLNNGLPFRQFLCSHPWLGYSTGAEIELPILAEMDYTRIYRKLHWPLS